MAKCKFDSFGQPSANLARFFIAPMKCSSQNFREMEVFVPEVFVQKCSSQVKASPQGPSVGRSVTLKDQEVFIPNQDVP